jgi:hypothetical protein
MGAHRRGHGAARPGLGRHRESSAVRRGGAGTGAAAEKALRRRNAPRHDPAHRRLPGAAGLLHPDDQLRRAATPDRYARDGPRQNPGGAEDQEGAGRRVHDQGDGAHGTAQRGRRGEGRSGHQGGRQGRAGGSAAHGVEPLRSGHAQNRIAHRCQAARAARNHHLHSGRGRRGRHSSPRVAGRGLARRCQRCERM